MTTEGPSPILQFSEWLEAARTAGESQPDAMVLATATSTGHPSARTVILRGVGEWGFVFYTGYNTPKAQDLETNPQASMVFYWPKVGRQVRVEGSVGKLSAKESDTFWNSRPREVQLMVWASPQSTVIESPDEVKARLQLHDTEFSDAVPRPVSWGGYRLVPNLIEFWDERPDRIHERLRYTEAAGGWSVLRLAP